MLKRLLAFASVPLLSIVSATAAFAQPQPPAACRTAIDVRLPGWQLSPLFRNGQFVMIVDSD